MALIGRFCRKNLLIDRFFSRNYTSSVAYDYDRWELTYPSAALTAAQADGHLVGRGVQWVFIGSPGVDKSAYASKLAELLNVPHISMGNLVREELRVQSSLSKQLSAAVSQGKLLPDNIIFKLLSKRWELGDKLGESGFILDGFPRTRVQAEILDRVADIDMAINFKCKEEVNLIRRCLGRRTCSHCGRTFNVANADSKVSNLGLNIPLSPAQTLCTCLGKFVTGASDAEEILKEKLRIYSEQSKALEAHYCNQRKLLNFEVPGDKQETWTGLLAALDLKDVDKAFQQLTC